MAVPKSLQGDEEDEEAGQEETEDVREENDEDQEASAPMEGEGQGGGSMDETWGDISFSSQREVLPGDKEAEHRELKMNWHISKYLPEEGSCRSCFQVGVVWVG